MPPFGRTRVHVVEMPEVRPDISARRRSRARAIRSRPPSPRERCVEGQARRARRCRREGRGAKPLSPQSGERRLTSGLPSASPRTGSAERVRGRGRELPRPLTPTLSPQAGRGRSLAASCHILHRRSLTPAPLPCGRGGSELVRHRGAPVLAAFSASYHQIVGKAEPPYSRHGSRAGRSGSSAPCGFDPSSPLRHDVVVGEQHAVERLRRRRRARRGPWRRSPCRSARRCPDP